VVSTAGPYGVHAPAYALRRSGKAKKWIADWRDLWVDNHIYPGLPGFRLIERALERRWSKQADIITTVSPVFAKTLSEKYGDKIKVIFNGFDADDYENLPQARIFEDDNIMRIVYTGTIYPKNNNLMPLFSAISELDHSGQITSDCIQFIFCGRNTDFSDLVRSMGISQYFSFLGLVPRNNALRMQRDSTALLFLEFEAGTIEGVLSGKIFEYLFAGPPIISLGGNAESTVAKLLTDTSKGTSVANDAGEIKKHLLDMKNRVSNINSTVDRQVSIDFFSRQFQADEMLRLATVT
jgi:glycosyltransferase involved in cell wall biosynthesis